MLKRVYTAIGTRIARFKAVVRLSRRRVLAPNEVRNIYILCSHGAGDYLMTTSAVKAIDEQYKGASIVMVFQRKEALLLARLNTLHESHELRMVADVLSDVNQIDLLIVLSGPSAEVFDIINTGRVRNAVGFVFSFRIFSNFFHRARLNYLFDNHIFRNDEVARELQSSPDEKIHFVLRYAPIRSNKGSSIGLYFPLLKKQKALPVETLLGLGKLILTSNKYETAHVLNFSGEEHLYSEFFTKLDSQLGKNLIFKEAIFGNWEELMLVLCSLDKVICSDSVVFHLCNALSIPVIGVFGPTDPKNYIPEDFQGNLISHNSASKHCYYGTGYNKCLREDCVDHCYFMHQVSETDFRTLV